MTRNHLFLTFALTLTAACSKYMSDRDTKEKQSDSRAAGEVTGGPQRDDSLSDSCAPQPITGTNLSLIGENCNGRPVDEGEGVPGYLTDPKLLTLRLPANADSTTTGAPGSISSGDPSKSLIVVFALQSQEELNGIVARNGQKMKLNPSKRAAFYALADGSFKVDGFSLEAGKPVVAAVASSVAKDGSVTIAEGIRQFAYMEHAVDGGEFHWPTTNGTGMTSAGMVNRLITAGENSSCIVYNGSARCWGENTMGVLGLVEAGITGPKMVVGLDSGVTAISSGSDNHVCAIQNGGARCWGAYSEGQIGVANIATPPLAITPTNMESGVTSISAGNKQTCAIQFGGVKCWGNLSTAALTNSVLPVSAIPASVSGLESGATMVSSGLNHNCAIVNGAAKCWGDNSHGQLGTGNIVSSSVPVQVLGLESGVTVISAGRYSPYTCAVVNGAAKCWGQNDYGQVSQATESQNYLSPTQVNGLTTLVTDITTGAQHTCAIVNKAAVCWGRYAGGVLGTGVISPQNFESRPPTTVISLGDKVTGIAASRNHTCAIYNGTPQCWGTGTFGELGNGVSSQSTMPVIVPGF